MAATIITMILDVLLAGLLVATIVFCGKLNRRVRVLQDSKSDLATLITQFNQTTERASDTIEELKSTSKKIVEQMQVKINKANYLADDLNFMIEKGEKIAGNLEGEISAARPAQKQPSAAASHFTGSVIPPRKHRETTTSRERTQAPPAAGSTAKSRQEPTLAPPAGKKANNTAATVEATLSRLGKRDNQPPAKSGGISARIRTQAERELMDALKQQH